MEQKIALLINIAFQKLIKLAVKSYDLQSQGYPASEEFCELTKLQAAIDVLRSGRELSLDDLESIEGVINENGGNDKVGYKPPVVQPSVEVKPKDCCCDNTGILDLIDDLRSQINYEPPTLTLTPIGLDEGTYEVGFGVRSIDVNWSANKIPLTVITVNFPADLPRASANLVGTHNAITIDLSPAEEKTLEIYGWYNDKQPYKGQNLLAEDKLCFKSKWPCYWGAGPENALDNPAAINTFILSLTRELSCPGCVEADLQAGEVLYFFFPYKGKAKQFVTDNGIINNSYKGTVEEIKTQSLIDNSLPGSMTYGVIRTDQAGIGFIKACLVEAEWPEAEVVTPPVVSTENIDYDGIWSKVVCVKQDEVYEGLWTNSVCLKDEVLNPAVDSFDAAILPDGADWRMTWFLQYQGPVVEQTSFSFTALVKDAAQQVIHSQVCTGILYFNQIRYDSPSPGIIIPGANGLSGLTVEVVTNSLVTNP